MKSLIIFQNGQYIRLKKKAGTSQKQFEFFINNSSTLGVTGWYSDSFKHFSSLFPKFPKKDFDSIDTREG